MWIVRNSAAWRGRFVRQCLAGLTAESRPGRPSPTHRPQPCLLTQQTAKPRPIAQASRHLKRDSGVSYAATHGTVELRVLSFRTSRTGVSRHRGHFPGVASPSLSGLPRRCRDVEGPACRNCCDCRKAQARGGSPLVQGGPLLGLRTAGSLPSRGRGGVRAAIAAV